MDGSKDLSSSAIDSQSLLDVTSVGLEGSSDRLSWRAVSNDTTELLLWACLLALVIAAMLPARPVA